MSIRSDDPPFEAWEVPHTNGRVWLRIAAASPHWFLFFPMSSGGHTLELDSLSEGPRWVVVQQVSIPQIPKGYAVATDCAQGDRRATGRVVALVRTTGGAARRDVRQAWEVEPATLHLTPASPDHIECRNPTRAWQSP